MDITSMNIPEITMNQAQRQSLQFAKRTIYSSKGGEKLMNKPAIILSGIAVASIVAIALYSPLSQENSAQPIVGQFVQPAHAQEVLAQAESQIVEMSDGDKKVLDELFKG